MFPANGQAAEQITERNIRYYRTLGLLDAPLGNYVKSFGEKHFLQLAAIRVYQAQGLPLRKIRDQLYGQSEKKLRQFPDQFERNGLKPNSQFTPPNAAEAWQVAPLSGDYLLVARGGRLPPAAVIDRIKELLAEG